MAFEVRVSGSQSYLQHRQQCFSINQYQFHLKPIFRGPQDLSFGPMFFLFKLTTEIARKQTKAICPRHLLLLIVTIGKGQLGIL